MENIHNTPHQFKLFMVLLKKINGVNYTPQKLAIFLAEQIIELDLKTDTITILEPSVGNGALILNLINSLQDRYKLKIVCVDLDDSNFDSIEHNIKKTSKNVEIEFIKGSFLEYYKNNIGLKFDVIIANPPYVRNENLHDDTIIEFKRMYDLKNKIDLYYIFVMVCIDMLSDKGVMGAIVSNKFINIKSGNVLRNYIVKNSNIVKIIDLGDTKIFKDAAVLPCVIILSKQGNIRKPLYINLYQTDEVGEKVDDVFDAISSKHSIVCIDTKNYVINRGNLLIVNDEWRMSNNKIDWFLSNVEKNTELYFKDVFDIKVGIKSTADKIFINNELDMKVFKLVREIITSKNISNFVLEEKYFDKIIYPYINENGINKLVDLKDYPLEESYLLTHKEKLENRKYLIQSGKKWYEIWVNNQLSLICKPKIIFTDISTKPKFCLDLKSRLVNGECFWMTLKKGVSEDYLWLSLAIANSEFILEYYDCKFNNRLLNGRRRFTKQYVNEFPLPNVNSMESIELTKLMKKMYEQNTFDDDNIKLLNEKLKIIFNLVDN